LLRFLGHRLRESDDTHTDPDEPSGDHQPPETGQKTERKHVAVMAEVMKLSAKIVDLEELRDVQQTDHSRVARQEKEG
jgi:hypothetical protein